MHVTATVIEEVGAIDNGMPTGEANTFVDALGFVFRNGFVDWLGGAVRHARRVIKIQ